MSGVESGSPSAPDTAGTAGASNALRTRTASHPLLMTNTFLPRRLRAATGYLGALFRGPAAAVERFVIIIVIVIDLPNQSGDYDYEYEFTLSVRSASFAVSRSKAIL